MLEVCYCVFLFFMVKYYFSFLLFLVSMGWHCYSQPVALCPENPHYLFYRGAPMLVVSSGEHYGAVLNPAFDYIRYLDCLEREGMNYTRIFTGGMYFELKWDFGISNNTLAPEEGTVITPWLRSSVEGNRNGGMKFDLDQWDEAYFTRLRDFVYEAEKRGILVEVTLFTSIYNEKTWGHSPVHPDNNINGTDIWDYKLVHTCQNGKLMYYQERLVRRIVKELNGFDNVIYEVQNEPWADQTMSCARPNLWEASALENWQSRIDLASTASLEWQSAIVAWIKEVESSLPKKHLIAQNYCNYLFPLSDVNSDVSILNFHYAWPDAARLNYGWNRVIGNDETGFSGKDDATYRQQAWIFLCGGGGLFNNLDYSFAPGYEDGTLDQSAPGGGSRNLRKQLFVLRSIFENMNFVELHPDCKVVDLCPGAYTHAISNGTDRFIVYLNGGKAKKIHLNLPMGNFRVRWIEPETGHLLGESVVESCGGIYELSVPAYETDMALTLVKGM